MTSIDQWIDSAVQTLKNSGKFNDMVFLKEYQTRPFEVPIKNFLVVVTLDSMKKNGVNSLNYGYGNRKDSSSAGFIVYAPCSVSGYTLTQRALELFNEISALGDDDEDIPQIYLEPIKFDEKADTLCREITVTFIKYSENSSSGGGDGDDYFELLINDTKIENLVDVEYTDKRDYFNAESYLTDIPSRKVPLNGSHTINVRKRASYADSLFYEPEFSAKLLLDGSTKCFEKCIVTVIKTHLVDGYLVTDIEFTGDIAESGDGEDDGQ